MTGKPQAPSSTELLAAALKAVTDGVVITDPSGAIVWANSGFTRLTGYSASEALASLRQANGISASVADQTG